MTRKHRAVMDAAPLLPPKDASVARPPRPGLRGRGLRYVLVAVVFAVATFVYFCGAALPLAAETTYHPSLVGYDLSDATDSSSEEQLVPTGSSEEGGSTPAAPEGGNHSGFVLDTPGCRIPDMAARSKLILQYIREPEPRPKCDELWSPMAGGRKQRGPPLVQSNLTAMWVVPEALHHYNVSHLSSLACCYRPFWRVKDDPLTYGFKADSRYKVSEQCVPFSGSSVTVDAEEHEFVRVECSRLGEEEGGNVTLAANLSLASPQPPQEVYRDFHAFVPVKRRVEERCMKTPHSPDEVSVLILGIDAVSRLNMLRELPLLHAALSSLSSVSLLGYTKVGDNTFPNVVPVLAGLAEDELRGACPWPSARHKLDPCPFLWKQFAARGYRTAYGEDCTWMSSFNYAKTGFFDVPTDYYSRPFLQAAENEQGHSKRWNIKLCVGPRLALANILHYARKFALRFANERYFGFFWTNSVSHDFLNMPHNGDLLYAELLRDLAARGALDRTVLVVLSDHGIRWGGIRETYQGRMEERLPFAFLAFPEWFRLRFPAAVANLRRNARNRLTTPFDLHETLRDLLQPGASLEPETLRERAANLELPNTNTTKKGISLFLPIPTSRTCKSAHIPPHFCTCQESTPVAKDDVVIKRIVKFVISEINSWLRQYHQCSQLKVSGIRSARKNVPLEEVRTTKSSIVDYLVTFETHPGGGLFEATVRESPLPQPPGNASSSLQLAGTVSRINRYGDQSRCVSDFHMKLYCFCT